MNIEINCTYVNLRLLLLFLCNLGSIHGHFIRFCDSLFVRCCFPTQSEARQVTLCSLNSQMTNLSRFKEPRTDSPWKRQILLGQVSFLSLPLVIGIAMCFLWERFLKVFDSGQSDVSSGNSMTTCCVVSANILNRLIQLDNSKHRAHAQSVDYLSVGRSIFCHAILTTRFPWVHVRVHHVTCSHWGSWVHVRLPKTINFQKISHTKHIAIPMNRGKR